MKKLQRKNLNWISRKKRNKVKHAENGNRKNKNIKCAFWNDKMSAMQKGSSVRDKISATLSTRCLSLLGVSEANLLKDDPEGSVNIKGYDLIPDNLLKAAGRARSAIYVSNKILYKVRHDLMDPETSEVWVEIEMSNKTGKNLLGVSVLQGALSA